MPDRSDPLYLTGEAGAFIRTNPRTLERWRTTGDGPEFVKLGKRVFYKQSSLESFIERNTRQHTNEE